MIVNHHVSTAAHSIDGVETLVAMLRWRAQHQPDQVIYRFLQNSPDDVAELTYAELDRHARRIAAQLQRMGAEGARALLLYPPGLEFIVAFFGCLYAKTVAVPAYPPNPAQIERTLPRLRAITVDAQPTVVLTTAAIVALAGFFTLDPDFQSAHWLATDTLEDDLADHWQPVEIRSDTLAFLQYTSGSTGTPRGVIVSHGNLMHNERMIQQAFGHDQNTIVVGWLPTYHDMGLIGNVLQPLYLGVPCTLMAPQTFLQSPIRWLQAISHYRATTSGGPNFAYELCVRKTTPEQRAALDLSSWQVAFNGAEPVRHATLERFAAAFAPAGFRKEAFYPCYGLAEATLLVTGNVPGTPAVIYSAQEAALARHKIVPSAEQETGAHTLVGAGRTWCEQRIQIVDPETSRACAPGQVGEIWIGGPSVAQGYWNRPQETEYTFGAQLEGTGEGPFLRTGDLGFVDDGSLFVAGRLKDLIIIHGRNYYPHDIEATVEQCHPVLRPGCGAAFAVEGAGTERLVIVQEIDQRRGAVDVDQLVPLIRQTVTAHHDVPVYAIVLLKQGSIPKTSSGKIQRYACRDAFLAGTLEVVGASLLEDAALAAENQSITLTDIRALPPEARPDAVIAYLRERTARLLGVAIDQVDPDQPFTHLGLDSVMAAELQYTAETNLGINLPMVRFLEEHTIAELAREVLAQLSIPVPAERSLQAIPAAPQEAHPLSFVQQSLWFMTQAAPESRTNILACIARVVAPLDVLALQRSVQHVVDRHAALRTTFSIERAKPVQWVHEAGLVVVQELDGAAWAESEVKERLAEAAYQPFKLDVGPLLRVLFCTRSAQEHYLVVALPHIVVDFRSLVQVMREVGSFYTAQVTGRVAQFAPVPFGPIDYVHWEAAMLAGPAGVRLWTYWRDQLAGAPTVLDLPTDHPRPEVQTYRAGVLPFTITEKRTEQLKALAENYCVTMYMTLLAAFQALLHRYTQQSDFLIGSPMAGRGRAEFSGLVCSCARPVVLRARLEGNLTFAAFLEQTRRTVLDAITHQDMPFALLVERLQLARNANRSALFQVMFNFLSLPPDTEQGLVAYGLGVPGVQAELGALVLESLGVEQPMDQFDMTLLITGLDQGMAAALHYNANLFDAATATRIVDDFQRLLDTLATRPEQPLAALLAGTPRLKQPIVIAATFTVDPIGESLAFWSTQLGLPLALQFAPYNQVFQQLLDPSSPMLTNRDGVNVLLLRLEDWAHLAHSWHMVEQNVHDFLEALRAAVQQCPALYLIGLCPASEAALAKDEQRSLLERMERLIAAHAESLNGVYYLDVAEVINRYQVREIRDPFSDDLGHIPFTPAFFAALGTAIIRNIYMLQHQPFKVIAVDCDQTLWGGICGEDGPHGLRIDAAHLALQQFLLKQRQEGMLLCLCTKNNEDDVVAAFQAHPEMPLKLEHFSATRINWLPKSDNMVSLAEELQLGLKSFIFLDDSPLECAEVERACPDVLALQLPDGPVAMPAFLDHAWAFDKVRVTEEARRRPEFYAQHRQREELRANSPTLEAFLAGLDLSIVLSPVTEHQLARVAELTQRTNQFNLTTIRRTESQIAHLLGSNYSCWVVDVRDRFGDYGLVGAVIARVADSTLEIDTFVLSCRVLGRRVEDAILERLAAEARAQGLRQIVLTYRPTPKNAPARQFLACLVAPASVAEDGSLSYTLPVGEPLLQSAGQTSQSADESAGPAHQSIDRATSPGDAAALRQSEGSLLRRIALELTDAERIIQAIRAQKQPRERQVGKLIGPRNEIEAVLAGIWCELLGVAQVSIHDDFFALGGHSLLATQMLSRIRDAFGVELPLNVMFVDTFSVADVAHAITDYQLDQADPDRLTTALEQLETLSDEELSLLLESDQL